VQSHRRPALHGVRDVAAETGLEAWKIAVLAREGHAQIIFSLVMLEQRRRRLRNAAGLQK